MQVGSGGPLVDYEQSLFPLRDSAKWTGEQVCKSLTVLKYDARVEPLV